MSDKLKQDIPNTSKQNVDANLPAVLLPYQREWIAEKSMVKVCEKSRRIGITWAEAADNALIAAASKEAGGQNVYYIGYNQDMAVEYIEYCAMWARSFNYAASEIEEGIWEEDSEDKHIKTYTVRFPGSKHRIVALSSRPTNLRGRQGVAVLDEAAYHDQLPRLIKAALAFLIWGGKVRILSTHDGEENPFNEFVHDIRSGKRKGTVHKTTFMEAVEQGLYSRVCLRLGRDWDKKQEEEWVQGVYDFYGEDAGEELDVIPSRGSGAYLPITMIEAAMTDEIPVLRWEPPARDFVDWPDDTRFRDMAEWLEVNVLPHLLRLDRDKPVWFGEDFGRVADLTDIWPIFETFEMTWMTPFVLELRDCPFAQQEQALFYTVGKFPRLGGGALDKGGNGAFLAERARQKFGGPDRIHEISLSTTWYTTHMPPFKAAFEDKTFPIPRDPEIRDDYRAIKKIKGVPMVPRDERTAVTTLSGKKAKRHGDAAIAGCLAYYAARNIEYGGVIEYQSTGRTRVGAEPLEKMERVGFGAVGGNVDTGGF
ncbi:hypothetical protein [Desulfonatronovibrio hydrogenovorans]|uniref:hypothetical protein n=1 Tax=Desulfonatronovibrio hydrogenovorans TaxID=53245 RepID=UPI0006922CD4|nr:hypothetical protein [Desulfonatronovibrio hydrogenovorans]